MYWFTLALGIAATVVFLVLRVKKGGLPGLISKAVASVGFIATALAAIRENSTEPLLSMCVVLGLVCGLLGDVWLDLKWIYPKDVKAYLYAGFVSFLVGHVFFNIGIYTSYDFTVWGLLISMGLSLFVALMTLVLEKPLKMVYGEYKTIIFIYTFALSMTLFSSGVAAYSTGWNPAWVVMCAGGIAFLLSDLVLSGMYFGEGKNTKFNVVLNHTLYYGAQFAIAASMLFAPQLLIIVD